MSHLGFHCLRDTAEGFARSGGQRFPVRLVPHAVDDVFRPVETNFRELIDVPADAFLVGIVAANYGTRIYDRKGFSDMAAAMARFMDVHPDAYLYAHTLQKTFDGIDLPLLFAFKGIPADRLRWADQYAIKSSRSPTSRWPPSTARSTSCSASRGEDSSCRGSRRRPAACR